jgi:DNA polymerase III epsilon subunit-like protein
VIPNSLINLNGELMVAVDTETTGLIPGYHEIIQIAVVPLNSEFEPHEGLRHFYMNIAPDHPDRQSGAVDVHGIDTAELATCVSQEEAADMFDQWYTELELPFRKRLVPLAHNWAFERSFLLHWLGLQTFSDLWSGHPRDTMIFATILNDLAAWHGKDCPFPKVSLLSMCDRMGIELLGAHNALADCLATAKLYREMIRLFH